MTTRRIPLPLVVRAIDFPQDFPGDRVQQLSDCAGILIFDQWTCNIDARQLLFTRSIGDSRWKMSMIDQGNCFNGWRWDFPDCPLWGVYKGLAMCVKPERLRPFDYRFRNKRLVLAPFDRTARRRYDGFVPFRLLVSWLRGQRFKPNG